LGSGSGGCRLSTSGPAVSRSSTRIDRSAVVCNGEIYNFQQLRSELRGSRTHVPDRPSDVEVDRPPLRGAGQPRAFSPLRGHVRESRCGDARAERLLAGSRPLGRQADVLGRRLPGRDPLRQRAGQPLLRSDLIAAEPGPRGDRPIPDAPVRALRRSRGFRGIRKARAGREMLVFEGGSPRVERYLGSSITAPKDRDPQMARRSNGSMTSSGRQPESRLISDVPVGAFPLGRRRLEHRRQLHGRGGPGTSTRSRSTSPTAQFQ